MSTYAGYGILPSTSDSGIKLFNSNREIVSLSFENIDYSLDASTNVLTLQSQQSYLAVNEITVTSSISIPTPGNYYSASYEEFAEQLITLAITESGFSSSTNPYAYVNIKVNPTSAVEPLELTLQYQIDSESAVPIAKYPFSGVTELNFKVVIIYDKSNSRFIVKAV